jgi:hypothetical protein
MPIRRSTYRNLDLLHTEDLRICYPFGTHLSGRRCREVSDGDKEFTGSMKYWWLRGRLGILECTEL